MGKKNKSVKCAVYGYSCSVTWYDTFEETRKRCVDVEKSPLPELDKILGLE